MEFFVLCNSSIGLKLFQDKKLRKIVYLPRKRVREMVRVVEMALADPESPCLGIECVPRFRRELPLWVGKNLLLYLLHSFKVPFSDS